MCCHLYRLQLTQDTLTFVLSCISSKEVLCLDSEQFAFDVTWGPLRKVPIHPGYVSLTRLDLPYPHPCYEEEEKQVTSPLPASERMMLVTQYQFRGAIVLGNPGALPRRGDSSQIVASVKPAQGGTCAARIPRPSGLVPTALWASSLPTDGPWVMTFYSEGWGYDLRAKALNPGAFPPP